MWSVLTVMTIVMSSSLSSSHSWLPSSRAEHHQSWPGHFNKHLPRIPKSLRRPSAFNTNYHRSGPRRNRPRVKHHFEFDKYPLSLRVGHSVSHDSIRSYNSPVSGRNHDLAPVSGPSFNSVPHSSPGHSSGLNGCDTSEGFKSGGETWQLAGCRRAVCAISLDGAWKVQEDSCDGLLQNPQYQCVFQEDPRTPYPDCCASTKQCREIGPLPQ